MPPTRKPHTSQHIQTLSPSSLLSLLGSMYSHILLLFIRSSLSLHRPDFSLLFCTASSVIHLILFSLSPLVSSPLFLNVVVSPGNPGRHIPDRFLLPLLCSLISPLFSSYLLLSSHFSLLSPLFASPLSPCLSFPLLLSFFASIPSVGCLVLFSRPTQVASFSPFSFALGKCGCVSKHPTSPSWQRTSRSAHSPPAATCLLLPNGKAPKSPQNCFQAWQVASAPRQR